MFQRKSDSISIKSLILIADYLDVTTDYLLKGDLSFNNVEDYMLNEVSTIYAELPLPKKVKLLDNAITLKKEAKSDE